MIGSEMQQILARKAARAPWLGVTLLWRLTA
jgi:hypothetical protein